MPITALEAARHNLFLGLERKWAPERIALLLDNVNRERKAAAR